MSHPNDPVVVFSGNTIEAGLMKDELENNGIPAFLQDEFIGTIAPWQAAAGGAGAVKVTVAQRDFEKAIHIVQQFSNGTGEK
jgi:hypothetical protein